VLQSVTWKVVWRTSLLILLAALIFAGTVAVVLVERHDDERECKIYQLEFYRSFADNRQQKGYSAREALIYSYAETWRHRPEHCPSPVPTRLEGSKRT
jgi:hypothetical protein